MRSRIAFVTSLYYSCDVIGSTPRSQPSHKKTSGFETKRWRRPTSRQFLHQQVILSLHQVAMRLCWPRNAALTEPGA